MSFIKQYIGWNRIKKFLKCSFLPRKKSLLNSIYPKNLARDYFDILAELTSREPIFHHPSTFGKTQQDIENQMCDDFWEVGASGNVYTQQEVIKTLLERYNNPDYQDIWEAKDFKLTQISSDNYLLAYVLIQNKIRITRRSTIWRRVDGDWKILYHQGTVIQGGNTCLKK